MFIVLCLQLLECVGKIRGAHNRIHNNKEKFRAITDKDQTPVNLSMYL